MTKYSYLWEWQTGLRSKHSHSLQQSCNNEDVYLEYNILIQTKDQQPAHAEWL